MEKKPLGGAPPSDIGGSKPKTNFSNGTEPVSSQQASMTKKEDPLMGCCTASKPKFCEKK